MLHTPPVPITLIDRDWSRVEAIDVRGGVEVVVERVEMTEPLRLHVRDDSGVDEREALALELDGMAGVSGKRRKRFHEVKGDTEFAFQSPLVRIVEEFHEEFEDSLQPDE